MATVSLTIDGMAVKVPQGTTILEAAKKIKIEMAYGSEEMDANLWYTVHVL